MKIYILSLIFLIFAIGLINAEQEDLGIGVDVKISVVKAPIENITDEVNETANINNTNTTQEVIEDIIPAEDNPLTNSVESTNPVNESNNEVIFPTEESDDNYIIFFVIFLIAAGILIVAVVYNYLLNKKLKNPAEKIYEKPKTAKKTKLLYIFLIIGYLLLINFIADNLSLFYSVEYISMQGNNIGASSQTIGIGDAVSISVTRSRAYGKIIEEDGNSKLQLFNFVKLPLKAEGIDFIKFHIIFALIITFFIYREKNKKPLNNDYRINNQYNQFPSIN